MMSFDELVIHDFLLLCDCSSVVVAVDDLAIISSLSEQGKVQYLKVKEREETIRLLPIEYRVSVLQGNNQ